MKIQILGPLAVDMGMASIVPSAGKPRQILALLAINNCRTVSVPTLVEELWGNEIPRSATTTLQTYILQLRRNIARTLPPGTERTAKDILTTSFGGYQLAPSAQYFDLREFEKLSAHGVAALEAGDAESASVALTTALSLWHGPALQDVPTGRVLNLELLGLQEARMRILDQRIVADLRVGRHAALIPELQVLAAQNPLHENFHAQLMLALHRAGSGWRALQAFQQLRKTLVAELGIEPSHRIQRLHRAILSGDLALDLHRGGNADPSEDRQSFSRHESA